MPLASVSTGDVVGPLVCCPVLAQERVSLSEDAAGPLDCGRGEVSMRVSLLEDDGSDALVAGVMEGQGCDETRCVCSPAAGATTTDGEDCTPVSGDALVDFCSSPQSTDCLVLAPDPLTPLVVDLAGISWSSTSSGGSSDWVQDKVMGLGNYLGISMRGFEEEVLALFVSIEREWERKEKEGSVKDKKLQNELRRLESSVMYDAKVKEKGVLKIVAK